MIKDDPETEELFRLAKTTPSKFRIMTIKDLETGLIIRVDQSMDASFSNHSQDMEVIARKMYSIYNNYRGKVYDGVFDGLNKASIGGLEIDFGDLDGKKAYNWLLRYIISLLRLMKKNGVITETQKGD